MQELKYSSNKRIEWEKLNENNNINNKDLKEKTKETKSKKYPPKSNKKSFA